MGTCVTDDGTSSRHAQHPGMAFTKALTGCRVLCQAGEAERLTALGFRLLLLLLLLQAPPKPGECSSAHEAEIHQEATIRSQEHGSPASLCFPLLMFYVQCSSMGDP